MKSCKKTALFGARAGEVGRALALPAIGLALVAAPVEAASVTYFFEATVVDDIEGPVLDQTGQLGAKGIGVGTPVTGSFTWDAMAAQSATLTNEASYFGPTSISASFAGVEVMGSTSDALAASFVTNDGGGRLGEGFSVIAGHSGEAPDLVGLSYDDGGVLQVSFFDSTGTAFSDTSLPMSLSLGDFDLPFFKFNAIQEAVGADEFTARITYLGTAPREIPLPAGLLLLATGLAALAAARLGAGHADV